MRATVEALRNPQLRVPVGGRPEIEEPDAYYDHQLIGLSARVPDGTVARPGHRRRARGAGPARGPTSAGAEGLVPFVAAIVPTVDLAGGRGRRPARGAVRPVTVATTPRWSRSSRSISPRYGSRWSARRRARPGDRRRAGPAAVDRRRAPHRRRLARTAAARGWSCCPSRGRRALDAVRPPRSRLVVPTPDGRPSPRRWPPPRAAKPGLVFACGRYEGIDARVAD